MWRAAGRHAVPAGAALVVLVATIRFGSGGALAAALLMLPALAWRYDNQAGVLFPLALLVMIAALVMAVLLVLMAIIH